MKVKIIQVITLVSPHKVDEGQKDLNEYGKCPS